MTVVSLSGFIIVSLSGLTQQSFYKISLPFFKSNLLQKSLKNQKNLPPKKFLDVPFRGGGIIEETFQNLNNQKC
jgi:hypothetical protein